MFLANAKTYYKMFHFPGYCLLQRYSFQILWFKWMKINLFSETVWIIRWIESVKWNREWITLFKHVDQIPQKGPYNNFQQLVVHKKSVKCSNPKLKASYSWTYRFTSLSDSNTEQQIFNYYLIKCLIQAITFVKIKHQHWWRKLYWTCAVLILRLSLSETSLKNKTKKVTTNSLKMDLLMKCIFQFSFCKSKSVNDEWCVTSTGMVVSAAKSMHNCKWPVSVP